MSAALSANGAALGEAACHAEDAYRSLIKMAIRLDAGGLDVTEELADLIEDAGDVASGLIQLADEVGRAAVDERVRIAA